MRSCAGIPATDRAVAAAVPLIQSAVLLAMRPVTELERILVMNVVTAAAACSVALACEILVAIPPAILAVITPVAPTVASAMQPAAVDMAGAGRPVAIVAAAATAVVACDVPADTDRPTVPAVRLLSSRAIAAARCRPAVEPPMVML